MTDDNASVREPLSDDTVADLHAGVLDEDTAARLWPQVRKDERARAVLAALDATAADLGALGSASAGPIPPKLGTRVDAALAEEAGTAQPDGRDLAPVVSIDTAKRRKNRLLAWGTGIVTTAAAAVVAVAVITPAETTGGSPSIAGPGPGVSEGATTALALHSGKLGKAVGSVVGQRDLGPLRGRAQLAACLAANGIDPDIKPAGVRPATIDGQRAVIVLYPTGEYARYRLIALPPDCGKNNPGLLKDTLIGRGAPGGG